MLKVCSVLWFVCLCGVLPANVFAITLQELEQRVSEGTNALAAYAALEESEAQSKVASPWNSLRMYTSGGYANNKEPATAGHYGIVRYEQTFAKTGVTIPLLGTWAKGRMGQLDAKARQAADKQYYEKVRNANRTALRKAWVLRWTESKKRDVLEALLKEESAVRAQMRMRLDEHSMLPAQAQTLTSYFEMARKQIALSNQLEAQAKAVMRQATGVTVPLADIVEPSLPSVNGTFSPEPDVLSEHPEVKSLDEAAGYMREKEPYAKWSAFDLNLDGGVTFTQDLPGAMGRSEQVGLTLSLPLNFWGVTSESDRAAKAQVRKAQHAARLKREELRDGLEVAQTAKDSAKARLDYAVEALTAAKSQYATSDKRQRELGVEGYEVVVSSRVAYAVAAVDGIDSISQQLQAQVEYLDILSDMTERFASTRKKATTDKKIADVLRLALPGKTSKKNTVPKETPTPAKSAELTVNVPATQVQPDKNTTAIAASIPVRAVYVWRSERFLGEAMERELNKVRTAGFNTVLMCFDAKQIAAIRRNGKPLTQLLKTARKKDLKVELLLGDPNWILPEGRLGLLEIIQGFSEYAFDGLHLDLEPDQLPDAERKRGEYAALTAETLRACAGASPWPISFDAHPRYFDPGTDTPQLAQGIRGLALWHVYLMAYNTDQPSFLARVAGVLSEHAALSFVVAQSYEASEDKAVSFYTQGKKAFVRHLNDLPAALSQKNFVGIAVQEWADFRKAQ